MSSLPAATVEMDLQSFIAQQSRLLSAERAEDVNNAGAAISQLTEKQLLSAGLALHKLLISDCHAGLYGRCLLTFVPAAGELLPTSQISVRDIVRVQPKQQQSTTATQQSGLGQCNTRCTAACIPPIRPIAHSRIHSHAVHVSVVAVGAVMAQTTVLCIASPTSPSS